MLHFYTLSKHQKIVGFSDVFRGYRNVTLGRNGLTGYDRFFTLKIKNKSSYHNL